MAMPSPAQSIEDLRKQIEYHNRLYYAEAKPKISDRHFDQLLEQLRTLEQANPELTTAANAWYQQQQAAARANERRSEKEDELALAEYREPGRHGGAVAAEVAAAFQSATRAPRGVDAGSIGAAPSEAPTTGTPR